MGATCTGPFDQLWYIWDRYSWHSNDGMNLATGPAPTPSGSPLPTFNPPYTPSPENMTISGGTGSVQTTDGIFSFGNASGSGWELNCNGILVGYHGVLVIDQMMVYGHSQLFWHDTVSHNWFSWVSNQYNSSTGPTARPIPINITMSPPNPQISHLASIGTFVSTVAATMSDGSGFSGTITIDDTTNFAVSGSSIVTNAALTNAFYFVTATVTQNGTGFRRIFDVNVT
jgi:hypothetical protein